MMLVILTIKYKKIHNDNDEHDDDNSKIIFINNI